MKEGKLNYFLGEKELDQKIELWDTAGAERYHAVSTPSPSPISIHPSPFILHPSSFAIIHPSSHHSSFAFILHPSSFTLYLHPNSESQLTPMYLRNAEVAIIFVSVTLPPEEWEQSFYYWKGITDRCERAKSEE